MVVDLLIRVNFEVQTAIFFSKFFFNALDITGAKHYLLTSRLKCINGIEIDQINLMGTYNCNNVLSQECLKINMFKYCL